MSSLEKVSEFATAHLLLQPGEQLLASARAMPLGGTKKFADRVGKAARFGGIGALVLVGYDVHTASASLEAAMKLGVHTALTDRRLILIRAGAMRGAPEEMLGSIERSRITGVDEGTTRVSFVKMVTLTFRCDDGAEYGFEYPKTDTAAARTLAAAARR